MLFLFQNLYIMKLLILIIAVAFTACSKQSDDKTSGNFCWSCEVTRWTDNVTFHKDTCMKNDWAPQFKDENGNDENSICQPK